MMCGRFDSFSFFFEMQRYDFSVINQQKNGTQQKKSPLAQALHAMTCKKSYFLTIF